MIKTNRTAYAVAAERVATGGWTVNPEVGVITGSRGAVLNRKSPDGYIHLKFRDPAAWREEIAVFAHRVIWEHVHGLIPDGMTINHINGIKDDNRIANLEILSVANNVRHAYATGLQRSRKGTAHPRVKLTESQVLAIYERCKTESMSTVAKDFDVSYWTVSSIKHGRNWAHTTGHVRDAAA